MTTSDVTAILREAPWLAPRPPLTSSPRAADLRAAPSAWTARTRWPGLAREEAFALARILTPCADAWTGRSADALRAAIAAGEKPCARALCYIEADAAAALVAAHPTRFCEELDFIAPVVAHAGGAALDFWFWHAFASTRRDRAFRLLPFLASPRMVPMVLDGHHRLDSLRTRAKAWFRAFPDEALAALVPLALGASFEALGLADVAPPKSAEPRRPATDAVRFLVLHGERERVLAIGRALGVEDDVRALVDVHPLAGASARTRPATDAADAAGAIDNEPPLSIDGTPLDPTLRRRYVELLDATSWDTPVPEVRALTDALPSAERAAFFGAMLDGLTASHRLHTLRTIFHAAADVPGLRDRLLALLRMQINVDEIKALGTCAIVEHGTPRGDGALTMLGELALSGASRSQEKLTSEVLAHVAEALDVPRDTLDDRLVPRLGLGDDGTRAIGGEATARLDASLRPYLLTAEGTRLADLPARAKKVRETAEAWKSLRGAARKVATGLERRARAWMLERQRWSVPDFVTHVLGHPVLRELARGFVWGLFDRDREPDREPGGEARPLTTTFRIAEDASLANMLDETLTLPAYALVGMVHPIELTEGDLATWQRILTEYEVLPIFTQLGWPTHRLTDAERAATTLTRLHGRVIESARLPADFGWRGIYEGVWFNGPRAPGAVLQIGRTTNNMQITFERKLARGLRAMVFFNPTGYSWQTRTIREVAVQRLTDLDWSVRRPWSDVDPVDASELLREMEPWLTP